MAILSYHAYAFPTLSYPFLTLKTVHTAGDICSLSEVSQEFAVGVLLEP